MTGDFELDLALNGLALFGCWSRVKTSLATRFLCDAGNLDQRWMLRLDFSEAHVLSL